eukprot:146440-Chlamydomonas_euryale.AAC.1
MPTALTCTLWAKPQARRGGGRPVDTKWVRLCTRLLIPNTPAVFGWLPDSLATRLAPALCPVLKIVPGFVTPSAPCAFNYGVQVHERLVYNCMYGWIDGGAV